MAKLSGRMWDIVIRNGSVIDGSGRPALLAGVVTYRDGDPTGALPGRLLRGGQAAPVAMAAE